jgi:hypothetical protein
VRRHVGQNFPHIIASQAANAAVQHHGPAHLTRGGGVGLARAKVRRGTPPETAARVVAEKQAKGHAAELRVSAEQCLDAGLRDGSVLSRPNPISNDPHVDVELLDGVRRVGDAQVGVGSLPYLKGKARRSRAKQVVINAEARSAMKERAPDAYERTSDVLVHEDTSSRELLSATVIGDATEILRGVLDESPRVGEWFKLASAAAGGAEAAFTSFGRSLLCGLVHRLATSRPIDSSIIDEAIDAGVDAFVKTGVQTYVAVGDFLDMAGTVFDFKLLRSVGGKIVVGGAIADVVVTTAKDLLAHLRGELTMDEVVLRGIVTLLAAGGGVMGWAVASKLTAGMPPWLGLIVTIALTMGGSWLGAKLGESLTSPNPISPVPVM